MTLGAQSKAIRVAVVGCGEFGRNHARVYKEMDGAKLVGVSIPMLRERKNSLRNWDERFCSLGELRGAVDAASVAVPTIAHAEPAAV